MGTAENIEPTAEVWRVVSEATDVTDEILEAVREITDGFYMDSNFEWEAFLNRLETWKRIDLGGSMQSPAIRKIQSEARKYKKEAQ
jgi:hypothetical protein